MSGKALTAAEDTLQTGDRPWVLVTDSGDGQARSSLAAVRALAPAGYRPAVAASGSYSLAAASRFCLRRVEVPPAGSPDYADAIHRELRSPPHLTVLAASDAALLALQLPGEQLVDKSRLAERALSVGLPIPATQVFGSSRDLLEHAGALDFPVVVKPSIRRSAEYLRTFRADSPNMPTPVAEWDGPLIVQPLVREAVHAVSGVVWRRRLVAACHQRYLRTWPMDCGPSSAAVTTRPDVELEQRLLALLDEYEGIFQAQFAGPYLLEVNPRVYGSLPLSVAAGANLVGVYCDLLRNRAVQEVRARPGVFYRWIEGDLRSLASAVRKGHMGLVDALGHLRPRPGAAHSTESLADPLPMMVRLRSALRRRR
jgi:predicted ATP-grasp superfamily ATP-dependent carboligase